MPTATPVQCPSCGFQIQAEDMNLQTMAARCRVCHALVDLRTDAPPASEAPAPAVADALPIPLPQRLTVSREGGGLRIERRWFSWTAIFMILFCTVWFGFLAVWYAIAFTTGNLLMLLFPLLHVAAGVFVAWWTAATLFNRTEFVISGGQLSVRHGPVPVPGKRDVPTRDLEQLYCEEHVSRSRNGVTITYSVRARTTDGRMVVLLKDLPDRDQALFIEQEAERQLRIANRPVVGELRR